jgi:hypothetical protein
MLPAALIRALGASCLHSTTFGTGAKTMAEEFDHSKSLKPNPPFFGRKPWIVVSANLMALALGAVIVWLAYNINPPTFHRNILVCLLGGLIGWVIGILATPLTKTESARFITLGQAISAFVSGYLISKLDRFLEGALYLKNGDLVHTGWERVGLFAASLLLMTIIVFLNRTYLHASRTV